MNPDDLRERLARVLCDANWKNSTGKDFLDMQFQACREIMLDQADAALAFLDGLAKPTAADSEAHAREWLADAFDRLGPTGYARHIRHGRCDWFWVKPAIDAMVNGGRVPAQVDQSPSGSRPERA